MKPSEIFQILMDAGVTISDFARLTEISRTSLHRWKQGDFTPIRDHLRLRIATETATKIQSAKTSGRLPLHEKYLMSERLRVLKRILSS